MSRTFVALAVGAHDRVHRQVNLAVLSLLANPQWDPAASIVIVTEEPRWYRWLGERIVVVDPPTLQGRTASQEQLVRTRLKAMQHATENLPGDVIYFDPNTVCGLPLGSFFEELTRGACFMYECESLRRERGETVREIYSQVGGKEFGSLRLEADISIWSAAVVALAGHSAKRLLSEAIECMDAMSAAGLTSRFLGELSMSLALARAGQLRSAGDWFLRYQSNGAPWNALIAAFFTQVALEEMSVDEACEAFHKLDLRMPLQIPHGKHERLMNGLRKQFFPRDHEIAAAVERCLSS